MKGECKVTEWGMRHFALLAQQNLIFDATPSTVLGFHKSNASTMAAEKEPHQAVLVFSAPVVKDLVSDKVRLPPNYAGIRRIRPSSFEVRNEFRGVVGAAPKTEVVYKITDADGKERRMNAQEKKRLKLQLRKERAEERKRQKEEADARASTENTVETTPSPHLPLHEVSSTTSRSYHQLEVSKSALEEELADLRGERDGVPPVMLSPPMANQAFQSGILSMSSPADNIQPQVVLDDELANRWAETLKVSMKGAEEVRIKEDMRPMPYQLVPEVWTRLRPESLAAGADKIHPPSPTSHTKEANNGDSNKQEIGGIFDKATVAFESSEVWSFVTVRRKRGQVDTDCDAVVSLLHRQSSLHISCGAKFGCDFLLYDGRRDQRHAFAGLRIIERTSSSHLPLPSSYDLTGYVRCLNTAGKLALLATVEHDESCTRVAFIDLALEKILLENKRKRSRRDVGKNLTKHR